MSYGESGGSEVEFETLEGRNWPSITQFSVFLENRVGQLLEVFRAFQGSKVKIVGLSISDSADCCIVALIQAEINIHYAYPLIVHPHGRCGMATHVDNIEQAAVTLHAKGFDILCEADLTP
jgi:hypothetical protein